MSYSGHVTPHPSILTSKGNSQLVTANVNNHNVLTSSSAIKASNWYLIAGPCGVIFVVLLFCVYCLCRQQSKRNKNAQALKAHAAHRPACSAPEAAALAPTSCHTTSPLPNSNMYSSYPVHSYTYQAQAPSSGGSVSQHPSSGGYTPMMQVNGLHSHPSSTNPPTPIHSQSTAFDPNFPHQPLTMTHAPRHAMMTSFHPPAHSLLRPVGAAPSSRSASRSTGIGAPLTSNSRYTASDVSSTFSAATGQMSLLPNPPSQVYSSVVGGGSSLASS